MAKKNSLVFFGNEVLATGVASSARILRALIEDGYDIKALIVSQDKPTSRSYQKPAVIQIASDNGIPILEDLAEATKIDAEAGILAAYGQILPGEVLQAYPAGIINIHPSLLPKYRGPTPIETALLDGVQQSGVSLIRLSQKMDAGPIYLQEPVQLKGDETKQELADKLDQLAADLLITNLQAILSGQISPTEQDESQASYTKKLEKADGEIDWSKPAVQIEREVRAYAGWPKSRANIHKHGVILTKVRVAKNENDGVLLQKTSDGWLEIQELIAPSGRKMTGPDFLRGYARI